MKNEFRLLKSLGLSLFMLLIAGCGEEQEKIENAKNVVAQSLIDPSSAEFGQISVFRSGLVCGEVNAKNRLGGSVFLRESYRI